MVQEGAIGGIIDFHTHAFPDALAARAMKALSAEAPQLPYYHDGRVSSLLASMDAAGIARSVVCSIATRPSQFGPILEWSRQIASDRIIPFPSIHPDDPNPGERIAQIHKCGFKGVKMHPFYQGFYMDEPRLCPIYEALAETGLLLVMHTGYDIAFERVRRADPAVIVKVLRDWPELRLVTTHLGAWEQWQEVEQALIGRQVYMEVSFTDGYLATDKVRELILRHPAEYVLFGTDSPWDDQAKALARVRELRLGTSREEGMLWRNAERLLGYSL